MAFIFAFITGRRDTRAATPSCICLTRKSFSAAICWLPTAPIPTIHMEKNGSAAGWIENAKGMIGLNADTYLTGHGDMMTKADVQKKLDFIQGKYNKIKAMAAQGKSLDEIKTSFGEPTAPAASRMQMARLPAATMTEVIYKEVSKTHS